MDHLYVINWFYWFYWFYWFGCAIGCPVDDCEVYLRHLVHTTRRSDESTSLARRSDERISPLTLRIEFTSFPLVVPHVVFFPEVGDAWMDWNLGNHAFGH